MLRYPKGRYALVSIVRQLLSTPRNSWDLPEPVHHGCDSCGSLRLAPRQEMAVLVESEGRARVAEANADCFEVCAGCDQMRAVGVAQIV